MISTFHGIEMGKRSLVTHTQAMNTTGHNLDNLNTEGYSRQVVKMVEFEPLYVPGLNREETPGMIGEGVITASIERVRDELLDNRIIFEGRNLGYHEMRNKYLHQLEMVYAEPSVYNDPSMRNTLRTSFDEFMGAWSNLANQPEEKAARTVVVEKANILTNSTNHHFNQITDIRNNVDMEIKDKVREFNETIAKIAHLNERIAKSEAIKDSPNDLYDQRDLLIDRISKMADINISREDKDELILYVGAKMIVQGNKFEPIQLRPMSDNEGYVDLYWRDGEKIALRGGELAGLVDMRDVDLKTEQKKINSFAVNITDLVNEIHKDGFAANGTTGNRFFVEHPFTTDPTGNFDANRDGVDESTYLFKISGKNELDLKDKIGIRGTMNINGTNIDYYETETLNDVIKKINMSDAKVNAFLNPQGKLTIKADYDKTNTNPDFVLRHIEDNGLFLTGYSGILANGGAAGAFDFRTVNETANKLAAGTAWSIAPLTNPAAYMKVEAKILADNAYIATAGGIDTDGDGIKDLSNGIGDSSTAHKIGSIKENRVMVGMSLTFSEYFEDIIASVGARANESEKGFKAQELIMANLENVRKSISGVNIDEEFANMIKFQHGYNASAKFITEMDKMIETIIFKLGV